jgi:hypothetical protein
MALLDSANTVGFYSEQIALTAANGFEKGKSYNIYISATVGGVTGTISHNFQIEAEVDSNTNSGGVDVTSISGDGTAADNLEADYDGTGYNKVASTINTVTNVTNRVTANTDQIEGVDATDQIGDAVWDEAKAGHVAAGSFGEEVQSHATQAEILSDATPFAGANIDAAISSRSSHSAADVWAVVARTITGGTIDTNNDKTGYALSAAGIQAIWDALTAALVTVGSIGKLIVDNLNATISSRATQADILSDATPFAGANIDAVLSDIETDTVNIQGRLPVALVGGRMDSSIGALAANTITDTAIAASGANEIADATLQRDMDQVEAGAPVHSLTTAVLKGVARTEDDGTGSLDIYRTDGVTVHASQTISTDPTADPIDGLNSIIFRTIIRTVFSKRCCRGSCSTIATRNSQGQPMASKT